MNSKMRQLLVGSLFTILLIGELHALTNEYNYQVYGVQPEKNVKITIDGKLNEQPWLRTPSMGEFHFIRNIDDQTEERQTVAKVFYTPEAIYLSVECYETEIDGIIRKITNNKNQAYWFDDCLEIYLETGRTYKKFYKFVINPNGVLWAMRVNNDDYDNTWQARAGVVGAAVVGKDRWTVEMRIPYTGFTKEPQTGDLWTFNIRRIRWGKKKKLEDSSWSPGASYSNPWRFGHLYFEKEAGQVNINTILELSRGKQGATVEVMLGKGRMFLESNSTIVDRDLMEIKKLLDQGELVLKRLELPKNELKKLFGKYETCRNKFSSLTKRRKQGDVSAETMALILLPLKSLRRQITSLIWDVKWRQMSISK